MLPAAVVLSVTNAVLFGFVASLSCVKRSDVKKKTESKAAPVTTLRISEQKTSTCDPPNFPASSSFPSPSMLSKVSGESAEPLKSSADPLLTASAESKKANVVGEKTPAFTSAKPAVDSKVHQGPEPKRRPKSSTRSLALLKSKRPFATVRKMKKQGEKKKLSTESVGVDIVNLPDEETQRTASVQVADSEDTDEYIPDLKKDDDGAYPSAQIRV
ncbi:hypothetical protein QR680_016437 [Steinernema hermaphroditum]|uniref:Uncharacterized protein n=1 Tax=Steinernema hermaphroditum TaxID=289476 RepID=A0AA39HB77_9BILA|nr:hypothetical protein QR680_016437 [Steinernema hermaphroditum]